MNDTPETDEAQFGTGRVSVDLARRLERERNKARAINADLLAALEKFRGQFDYHGCSGTAGDAIEKAERKAS